MLQSLVRRWAARTCSAFPTRSTPTSRNSFWQAHCRGGERIPEKKVADLFKVSRTPVREAIRKLAEYGLVVIKPRSYAFVATLSPEEARDISWVRLYLEKLSMRLFCAAGPEAAGEPAPAPRPVPPVQGGHRVPATSRPPTSTTRPSTWRSPAAPAIPNCWKCCPCSTPSCSCCGSSSTCPGPSSPSTSPSTTSCLKLLEKRELDKIEALLEGHILHDLNFK